jgi:hypothetical protein
MPNSMAAEHLWDPPYAETDGDSMDKARSVEHLAIVSRKSLLTRRDATKEAGGTEPGTHLKMVSGLTW